MVGKFDIATVTPQVVAKMFPATPGRNIRANLPHILAALQELGIDDRDMVLMALATIRAESEGFEPISEYQSRYNTAEGGKPFALYDNRADIGNRGAGDGAMFKGRGFIQLTGRTNYQKMSPIIGRDLVGNPEEANNPATAARILAVFLKWQERRIRKVLAAEVGRVSDEALKAARRLVNGGSHGLLRFKEAWRIGESILHG